LSKRLLFIVSEDWYFVSHRLHLAEAAINAGYKVALFSRFNNHRDLVMNSGIQVINWPLNRLSFNPYNELVSLYHLVSTIRKFKPDLIHAVAMKPIIYSGIVARYFSFSYSSVFSFAGLGYIFISQKLIVKLYRSCISIVLRIILKEKNTRIILQNCDDKLKLTSEKIISSEQVRLIRGSGVDTTLFHPGPLPSGTPLVILPARMLWDKGLGEFVKCARVIKDHGVVARFVLVGDPDPHNPESVSIEQLNIWEKEGVVEWWTHKKNMPSIYINASIICLPSYREGLPKALLEAASCGRPIVTYDVPGCREVVIDQVNGFLVPFKDTDAMVNAIETLLDNKELCSQMGQKGRELVLNNFSQEQIAAETMALWQEVLH